MDLQPLLHDLVVAAAAPTQVWSGRDAQIREQGVQGVFHCDLRVLSRFEVRVHNAEPEALGISRQGSGRVKAVGLARAADAPGADPTLTFTRSRSVSPGRFTEQIALQSAAHEPLSVRVEARLSSDLAPLELVKQGRSVPRVSPQLEPDGVSWSSEDVADVAVALPGAHLLIVDDVLIAVWDLVVGPNGSQSLEVSLCASVADAVVHAPESRDVEWVRPEIVSDDHRLRALVDQSMDDLASLRMTSDMAPGETFLAAGAPWFFTLFGRDSLWAARLILPLGTDLARGTLRTLAAKQGERVDPQTQEQPGKILHEVRGRQLTLDGGAMVLPPLYYGTVDATPLWVCLLHDAWRAGMSDSDVADLIPAMERALGWMRDYGDGDGDGFLDYVDSTGRGLSNQGWKDSGDSIQFLDGSLAEGPIALSEVQAYAYEAAISGAAILEAFGRPGADAWREWARDLADRFRAAFWVTDDAGRYPGIALDRHGSVVDTVTSNMGHLLGTGMLTPQEESLIAGRLVAPDMNSGYGLRTLSTNSAGFWPLRYHGGTVWPHDTAISIHGLARSGYAQEARELAQGVLEAAVEFDYQLPELFSGVSRTDDVPLLPYPAACHPQAWSAAAAVVIAQVLEPQAPR